jgi:hypothetical protein
LERRPELEQQLEQVSVQASMPEQHSLLEQISAQTLASILA